MLHAHSQLRVAGVLLALALARTRLVPLGRTSSPASVTNVLPVHLHIEAPDWVRRAARLDRRLADQGLHTTRSNCGGSRHARSLAFRKPAFTARVATGVLVALPPAPETLSSASADTVENDTIAIAATHGEKLIAIVPPNGPVSLALRRVALSMRQAVDGHSIATWPVLSIWSSAPATKDRGG